VNAHAAKAGASIFFIEICFGVPNLNKKAEVVDKEKPLGGRGFIIS